MLDYHAVKSMDFGEVVHEYSERDAILYALGIGLGANPTDRHELRYVYERDASAFPLMASVLAPAGFLKRALDVGIDVLNVVHGEQSVRLHQALPIAATVRAIAHVDRVIDRSIGAIIHVKRNIFDNSTGEHLATVGSSFICRGEAGYSRSGQPSDEADVALPAAHETLPSSIVDTATRPEMALLYRLSGDRNPLHCDPEVAAQAGFRRPILHGLATFGVAAVAILREFSDLSPEVLPEMRARFCGPVYPGEVIRTEMWREGNQVDFRATVQPRGATVLDQGHMLLG